MTWVLLKFSVRVREKHTEASGVGLDGHAVGRRRVGILHRRHSGTKNSY